MPLNRNEAAREIATLWVFVREDMKHLAKGSYDADAHNLCVAYVELADGSSRTLYAYSDSSKMNKTLQGFYEIPATAAYGDHFGLSMMQRAHTEPKLLNYVMNTFPTVGPTRVLHVTLATARDPCTSCTGVIATYNGWFPGRITVHGFSAQTGGGVPDLTGTPYG